MIPTKPGRPRLTLDFDIENRPLSYWVPDRPTAEITAIAWCFVDTPKNADVSLLGFEEPEEMLRAFTAVWEMADVVTGHYILKHDIPIIQAHLVEYGLPPLGPKLVQDTKVHLIGWKDLPKTQEHLAEMLGVSFSKLHMTQHMWREANRLTEAGLNATRKRVLGDVKQHIALRKALLERGLLGPPKLWTP